MVDQRLAADQHQGSKGVAVERAHAGAQTRGQHHGAVWHEPLRHDAVRQDAAPKSSVA